MTFVNIALIIAILSMAFFISRKLILQRATTGNTLLALPHYYSWCAIIWCILPLILIFFLSQFVDFIASYSTLITIVATTLSFILFSFFIRPHFHARKHLEKWWKRIITLCSLISIAITVMIVASVLYESFLFFQKVSFWDYIFGLTWSPQTALRADQSGSSASFGAIPVLLGTLMVTFIAMLVATPLGLFSAIYLTEYASSGTRNIIKPILEILAGIPTVVYGYFAVILLAPFVRNIGQTVGLNIASESALVAGIVMGIMIIPFILSLSDDVMNAVPQALKDASYALGATKAETITKVVFPAALPGIMGAIILGISRAIGETMIVVMVAGLSANLTLNPLEPVTTVTVQIVTLLVGDQEFDSAKTLAAFALGLTLFIITLLLNMVSLAITRKYQEQYD